LRRTRSAAARITTAAGRGRSSSTPSVRKLIGLTTGASDKRTPRPGPAQTIPAPPRLALAMMPRLGAGAVDASTNIRGNRSLVLSRGERGAGAFLVRQPPGADPLP